MLLLLLLLLVALTRTELMEIAKLKQQMGFVGGHAAPCRGTAAVALDQRQAASSAGR